MSVETRERIYEGIEYERLRQDYKHGDRSIANLDNLLFAFACLVEEVGELATALTVWSDGGDGETMMAVVEEAIQVAASAVALIENVQRRGDG